MTADDYASVDRASRVLHARGRSHAFSVNDMVESWERLIGRVEEGYDENIYEYLNDLSCRDWLARAWPLLTEHVREVRAAELDALDARFTAATVALDGRSLGGSPEQWWRWRRPTKLIGELAADLAAWTAD